MAAAWQMTVDKRMGMFSVDPVNLSPLAASEENVPKPNPPIVAPHQIWTKVSISAVRALIFKVHLLINHSNTEPTFVQITRM